MTRQARTIQRQPLGIQAMLHLVLAEPASHHIVLDDREPEVGALSKKERGRLGPGEASGLRHDAPEERVQLALAAERDAQLDELVDERRSTV